MFKVTIEPLNVQQINNLVKRPTDGAVVTFDGIVRNNFDGRAVRYLEYEAYAEMAERKMTEIGAEVRRKFAIGEIAIVHRLGRLEIGESSIVVAVAAPHRQAAFEACAYAMDRVKEEVPVWKKEFFTDGADHWVNQHV
jgi:molybdopterin synthase catalytic subunit